jgi:Transglutaminase-like superfamily
MSQVRRFCLLTLQEKLSFLEAFGLLATISLSIKLVAFRYIHALLQRGQLTDPRGNTFPHQDHADSLSLVSCSVSRAAKALPWETLCLSRSIAAFLMLRRRGIPTDLVLGVKRQASSLVAHAWIEVGSVGAGGSTYTPLIRIPAKPPTLISRLTLSGAALGR